MPLEIERKFLVAGDGWRGLGHVIPIRQGYLASSEGLSVRVRQAGTQGFLTVKGGKGIVRAEYEYAIPLDEATEMLDRLCRPPLIEKKRHVLDLDGIEWVVDAFEGALAGLILAEIELESAEQQIALPDWLGREVTDDPRYLNASLAKDGLPRGA